MWSSFTFVEFTLDSYRKKVRYVSLEQKEVTKDLETEGSNGTSSTKFKKVL